MMNSKRIDAAFDRDPRGPVTMRERIAMGIFATLMLIVGVPLLEARLPDPPAASATTTRPPVRVKGCMEDEAAVVAPDPNPSHGLTWVCVALDDWADEDSLARLDELLASRG